MSTKETLIAARTLIEDRAQWIVGTFALAGGLEVDPGDPRATRFCAEGAIYRADIGSGGLPDREIEALNQAARALYDRASIVDINDGLVAAVYRERPELDCEGAQHAAVLRCFDYAIEHD